MRAKHALAALLGALLVAACACSARELQGEGLDSAVAADGAGGRILAQAPGESIGERWRVGWQRATSSLAVALPVGLLAFLQPGRLPTAPHLPLHSAAPAANGSLAPGLGGTFGESGIWAS